MILTLQLNVSGTTIPALARYRIDGKIRRLAQRN